jgi:hypothetical protein
VTVKGMADHCPLCERPTETGSELCHLHSAAQAALEQGYTAWNSAYSGNLAFEEYITRLEMLSETGASVKAVIQFLRRRTGGG